ncbi:hypothetical protein SKAU_G00209890 [Synaphobranchus kaupii]|uniref:Uncharacterized protein n=1 Tax=Synaphobranchus kaupii TaxID=118154 RepID=A0A9Q1F8X3_SYNKA|nr:hypothetical protein SKAU_G00209890 [Synaphobranchus kaupii]
MKELVMEGGRDGGYTEWQMDKAHCLEHLPVTAPSHPPRHCSAESSMEWAFWKTNTTPTPSTPPQDSLDLIFTDPMF